MTKYGRPFTTYNIIYNGSIVGQLSSSSCIAHRMKTNDIELLTGFFISDVFYWSYQDTLDADKRKEKEFLKIPQNSTIKSQSLLPQNGAKMPAIKVIFLLLTLPDMANKL